MTAAQRLGLLLPWHAGLRMGRLDLSRRGVSAFRQGQRFRSPGDSGKRRYLCGRHRLSRLGAIEPAGGSPCSLVSSASLGFEGSGSA